MIIYQMTEPWDFKNFIMDLVPKAQSRQYAQTVRHFEAEKVVETDKGFAIRDQGKKPAEKTRSWIYYVDTGGRSIYVLLPDGRTVVFAEHESALGEVFGPAEMEFWSFTDKSGKTSEVPKAPMPGGAPYLGREAWEMIRGGHFVVAARDDPMQTLEPWPGIPELVSYGLAPFSPVLKSRGTFLGVRLGSPVQLCGVIEAPDENSAEALAKSVEAAVGLGKVMAEMYRKQNANAAGPMREPLRKLNEAYRRLLEEMKVTQKAGFVRAEAAVEPEAAQNLFRLLLQ